MRRSVIQSKMAIDISAQAPASMKAPTTARRASRIDIGPSVAVGATVCTARAKLCSTVLSLESPAGATSIRACPSDVTHCLLRSGGRLSSVTSCALNRLRRSSSAVRSGCTNTVSACWRTGGSALASAAIAVARRRAATAPEPVPLPASRLRESTVEPIMLTFCASVGGGADAVGLSTGSSVFAASWISGNFCCWSLGIKLDKVVTRATCGSARSFAAT